MDVGLPPPPLPSILMCFPTPPNVLVVWVLLLPTSSDSIAEIENEVDLFFGDSSPCSLGDGEELSTLERSMFLWGKITIVSYISPSPSQLEVKE